ncbi:D-alanine--poly(phosphoribitol) ligase subunit DltA [Listeria sp. FSL L7-1485]|uniref:D-alanine--D-alanyl carrier protein ligase n=1 Tax=Listeria immobilis TaxID=2713502 RepID=A0A7X1C8Y4_9LIST|nr:D-alanine--poly(phosphoribitol) ligase subunit DltA [Listeria immobilis]MBC1482966.1 D-alanine--poly(phosphoribitol) ligase subunit DltA [Listeria immobilis]MBC1488747.1 D-alanine--poly(phosphoribitol) ligase subunit DltA [Listeria immobilis]MBC1505878.1 D-alanine--poly(phosphoribitol) ligase subunit DltA [Listeria immobilis]MBC1508331.1 D-alanine--poly(phosphoribitol) ligase subunit DltA [Listeria immobilis]MBC1535926.1 D-alanine--poly(phosphoribitol) ligase subunit DltA [Listeria immobili
MTTSIIERIDAWAENTPNFPCYEYAGTRLSYQELKRQSDALGSYLLKNVTTDKQRPIIVYGHMSPLMIIAFLGSIKSGRAYVPVDVSMPVERIEQIKKAANPALFICTEALPSNLIISDCPILNPENLVDSLQNHLDETPHPEACVKNDDNYYIIYTSGSTGNPKGVQISQNNLVSFSNWILQDFSLEQGLRFLNQAPFSFDLSVMDLYPCLLSGGTLVPLDKTISANLKDLYFEIPVQNLDVWISTPSFAELCLLDANFNQENNPNLTRFLFCGEVLAKKTALELLNRFPDAVIYNTYGPTEATVAVTQVKVTRELLEAYPSLPLGVIKPDMRLHIIDQESGELVPDGQKGEIVLIGASVSKGYLNEPEKTAQVFFDYKGYQAYHTGDAGLIKDGYLFFQGRLDFQIKLHGYRIELEDIENNLKKVSLIHNCAIIPKIKDDKVEMLVAQVIPSTNDFEKEYQLSAAIKKELKKFMPAYMIPRKWIYKTEFPLTMNSKIDRKMLHNEVNK